MDALRVCEVWSEHLEFFDPFGIRWQVSTNHEFLNAGQIADRWLAI